MMEPQAIISVAKYRWLRPFEVFSILRTKPFELPVITAHQSLPGSGCIFFVLKSKFKRWKQDGHVYLLRKNGKGTREDREKYKDELDTVHCAYVHGAGICINCGVESFEKCFGCSGPVTTPTFHRRAYWLASNPDLVLVHYLDEALRDLIDQTTQDSSLMQSGEQCRMIEDVLKTFDLDEIGYVQILDCSPEWADTTGGTKVMICIEPAIMFGRDKKLKCGFGDVQVKMKMIQAGVLKCVAPPHVSGIVDLYIMLNDQEITETRKDFEFKEIRIISEKSNSKDWWKASKQSLCRDLLSALCEINTQTDYFIEDQSQESFFLKELPRIVNFSEAKSLDFKGIGLIHYLASLNFSKCIEKFGSSLNPNLKTIDGKSALEIAAFKEYKEAIVELLHVGADPNQCPLSNAHSLVPAMDYIFNEGLLQGIEGRVQLIQSHVRMWLYRRQFREVKKAASKLQKVFRGMLARKNFIYQKKAAVLIQKTVRAWLKGNYI